VLKKGRNYPLYRVVLFY